MIYRIEGFDHFTTQAQLITEPGWSVTGTITIETNQGRNGTGNLRTTGSNGCHATYTIPTPQANGLVNLAFSTDSIGVTTEWDYFLIRVGTTVHLAISVDTTGKLLLRLGSGGALLDTGTTTIAPNTYYHVQMKFVIDDASGSFELRLDGSASAELSYSGDTRNGATATWDNIDFRGQSLNADSPFVRFDDVVLGDLTDSGVAGNPANDWLGDLRVLTKFPETGNGANTGLTPSTGSDHGALVDESTPNDDTDYNSGLAVSDKDTYTFPTLGVSTSAIIAIEPVLRAKKTDAGSRSICPVLRSGGVDYDGADQALTTSYAYYGQVYHDDPDTGLPWDETAWDALEVGMKVTV